MFAHLVLIVYKQNFAYFARKRPVSLLNNVKISFLSYIVLHRRVITYTLHSLFNRRISLTTKPIWFLVSVKLHFGPGNVSTLKREIAPRKKNSPTRRVKLGMKNKIYFYRKTVNYFYLLYTILFSRIKQRVKMLAKYQSSSSYMVSTRFFCCTW